MAERSDLVSPEAKPVRNLARICILSAPGQTKTVNIRLAPTLQPRHYNPQTYAAQTGFQEHTAACQLGWDALRTALANFMAVKDALACWCV